MQECGVCNGVGLGEGLGETHLDLHEKTRLRRSGGYLWINDPPCAQTNATQRWGQLFHRFASFHGV